MGVTRLESFLEDLAENDGVYPASRPPPKLLLPDETSDQYERGFEQWLTKRRLTLASLRDPTVERLHRADFAMSRAWHLHCRKLKQSKVKDDRSENERPSSTRETGIVSTLQPYRGTRSRSELLDTKVTTAEEFVEEMLDINKFGPNGYMGSGTKLKPIPVILRPDESRRFFEVNFDRWVAKKNVSSKALKDDPEEERRLRQCFAYSRALEHIHREGLRSRSRSRSDRQTRESSSRNGSERRKRSLSTETERASSKRIASRELKQGEVDRHGKRLRVDEDRAEAQTKPSEENLPDWAKKLIESTTQRALQVDRRFEELERKIRTVRFGAVANATDSATCVGNGNAGKTNDAMADKRPPHVAVANTTESTERDVQHQNSDVVQEATKTLEKSVKIVSGDSEGKRLVEEYTRLTDQIAMNETAIEDSRAYAMQIMSIHKAEATEHLNQIKELTVSINQQKQLRDAALATVALYEWREKSSELAHLIRQPTGTLSSGASHEKLSAVYSQLKLKDAEVVALHAQLKRQLGRARHDAEDRKELRDVSRRLSSSLDERNLLDIERETLSKPLVGLSQEVRALVSDALQHASVEETCQSTRFQS